MHNVHSKTLCSCPAETALDHKLGQDYQWCSARVKRVSIRLAQCRLQSTSLKPPVLLWWACPQLEYYVLLCITFRKIKPTDESPKDRRKDQKIRPEGQDSRTEGLSGENWIEGNPNKFFVLEKATREINWAFYSLYLCWVRLEVKGLHFRKELNWRWLRVWISIR